MSVTLLNAVLSLPASALKCAHVARLALIVLAWRAEDDGAVRSLTISRLAREAGVDRAHLHRVLKDLRAAGFVGNENLNLNLDALLRCATENELSTGTEKPVDNSPKTVDNFPQTVDNVLHSATVSHSATVAPRNRWCCTTQQKVLRHATHIDRQSDNSACVCAEEAVHNSRPKVGDKGQGNRDYSQSGYAAANIADGCTSDESAATVGKRQAQAEIILKSLCFQCGVSDETATAALPLALELALTSDPEEAAQNALAAVTAKNGPKIAPRGQAATTPPQTHENARKGR